VSGFCAPAQLVGEAEQRFGQADIVVITSGGPAFGGAADVSDQQVADAMHLLFFHYESAPCCRACGSGDGVASPGSAPAVYSSP
jgi:NAD(P)-dependent dehydrogenase (short-subunit alcohol dehydrogenase family)